MTKKSKKESTLYYFYSVGCVFCTKVEPIVDKLNSNGYDIVKLDTTHKANELFKKEIEEKFKIKCGTPLLVNSDTGNSICGYRDEETIKKWADGEKIPKPPKPKSKPPKLPTDFFDEKQITTFKKKYNKWLKENSHLKELQTSEQIIDKFKTAQKQREAQKQSLDGRLKTIENNLQKLMNHLGVK